MGRDRAFTQRDFKLIGAGIYTVPEASRLTNVSTWRIKRWIRGYTFKNRGEVHASPPVVPHELGILDGLIALSFLDLVEIKFVDAFLDRGVSWKALRHAITRGRALVHHSHPFSTRKFWTDGRTILMELAERDVALLNLINNQLEFKRVIRQFLSKLDFERDQAVRWWPLGKHYRIVVDPQRSFGQPIVHDEGVPTAVLAKAHKVEKSLAKVASWFEMSKKSVRDAVKFEQLLAA